MYCRLGGERSLRRTGTWPGRGRLGCKPIDEKLGGKIELVGDDLFVSNIEHIQRGIDEDVGKAVPITLAPIGSLT